MTPHQNVLRPELRPAPRWTTVAVMVLTRTLGVVGLETVTWVGLDRLDPESYEINGVLVLFLVVALTFVWALVDAVRPAHVSLRVLVQVLATWVAVGLLGGAGIALTTRLWPGYDAPGTILAAVLDDAPFFAGLVAFPALFVILLVGVPRMMTSRPAPALQ